MGNLCGPMHPLQTLNIQSYTVPGFTVHNNQDHSKMAVLPASGVYCLGDINRKVNIHPRYVVASCVSQ